MRMRLRLYALFSMALCVVLSAMIGIARASGGPASMEQIKGTVAKVQSGKTVDARTDATEHLENLTRNISGREVTAKLVTDLISLLQPPDDSVRFYVVATLGNIGPNAKAAVPKLKKMLPKADCVNGVITTADAIRYALVRMGVKPAPQRKCGRASG